MAKGIIKILFNCLTTSRPTSLKPDLPPTTTFMVKLSFLVRVRKLKRTQPKTS
jgi:hypothetical protein